MNKAKKTFCIIAAVMTASAAIYGCADVNNRVKTINSTESTADAEDKTIYGSGMREVKIVTVMPGTDDAEPKKETIDFDLRHLSIAEPNGKEAAYEKAQKEAEEGERNLPVFTRPPESDEGNTGTAVQEGTVADNTGSDTAEAIGYTEQPDYGFGEPESDAGADYDTPEQYGQDAPEDTGYQCGVGTGNGADSVSDLLPDGTEGENDYTDSEVFNGEPESVEQEEESAYEYLGQFISTGYCPNSCCCGSYATGYTASGTLATEGRTVACNILPLGTEIMIDGHIYVVEDTGWSPYEQWIDIFYQDHSDALAHGERMVDVYLVRYPE